ncbi:hypothetical protein EAO71_24010 [Streptomyces sp. ms191]|nr:hypothetical protein EAO71_24010 [Streptomyces sp. ms191]
MVAERGLPWKAARVRMISTPLRHRVARRRRGIRGRRPPGRPLIRGVIVLTVKLFGETLESPRTLAVWQ